MRRRSSVHALPASGGGAKGAGNIVSVGVSFEKSGIGSGSATWLSAAAFFFDSDCTACL